MRFTLPVEIGLVSHIRLYSFYRICDALAPVQRSLEEQIASGIVYKREEA